MANIQNICDRAIQIIEAVVPDSNASPNIRFRSVEGVSSLEVLPPKSSPQDNTREFIVYPGGGISFQSFSGTLTPTLQGMVVDIRYVVTPTSGGFVAARRMMGVDKARLTHEMLTASWGTSGAKTVDSLSIQEIQIEQDYFILRMAMTMAVDVESSLAPLCAPFVQPFNDFADLKFWLAGKPIGTQAWLISRTTGEQIGMFESDSDAGYQAVTEVDFSKVTATPFGIVDSVTSPTEYTVQAGATLGRSGFCSAFKNGPTFGSGTPEEGWSTPGISYSYDPGSLAVTLDTTPPVTLAPGDPIFQLGVSEFTVGPYITAAATSFERSDLMVRNYTFARFSGSGLFIQCTGAQAGPVVATLFGGPFYPIQGDFTAIADLDVGGDDSNASFALTTHSEVQGYSGRYEGIAVFRDPSSTWRKGFWRGQLGAPPSVISTANQELNVPLSSGDAYFQCCWSLEAYNGALVPPRHQRLSAQLDVASPTNAYGSVLSPASQGTLSTGVEFAHTEPLGVAFWAYDGSSGGIYTMTVKSARVRFREYEP